MSEGRLSISRGHRGQPPAPTPRLVLVPREGDAPTPKSAVAAAAAAPAPAVAQEYQLAHERLAALERLARLLKQGALTAEEFAAEKALILSMPAADELVLTQPAPPPSIARGPSLLGRLLGSKLLPVGLAAGIGLSFAAQPRETMRFFADGLSLLGL